MKPSASQGRSDETAIPRRAKGSRCNGAMSRLHIELPSVVAVELRQACASKRITLATATEEAVLIWLKK